MILKRRVVNMLVATTSNNHSLKGNLMGPTTTRRTNSNTRVATQRISFLGHYFALVVDGCGDLCIRGYSDEDGEYGHTLAYLCHNTGELTVCTLTLSEAENELTALPFEPQTPENPHNQFANNLKTVYETDSLSAVFLPRKKAKKVLRKYSTSFTRPGNTKPWPEQKGSTKPHGDDVGKASRSAHQG